MHFFHNKFWFVENCFNSHPWKTTYTLLIPKVTWKKQANKQTRVTWKNYQILKTKMYLGEKKLNILSSDMKCWYYEKWFCLSWAWLRWGVRAPHPTNEMKSHRTGVTGGHRNDWVLTSDFTLWSKWCFSQVSCFSTLLHNDPLRQVDQSDQPSMQLFENKIYSSLVKLGIM